MRNKEFDIPIHAVTYASIRHNRNSSPTKKYEYEWDSPQKFNFSNANTKEQQKSVNKNSSHSPATFSSILR
jgi:hypothetical protein